MIKNARKLWGTIPEDIRQVIISLSVSLSLLAGSLTLLTMYLNDLSAKGNDAPAAAGVESESELYQCAPLFDISSLTTYDAIIRPAAPGTNGELAGACLPFSNITDGMGTSGE